MDQRYQAFTLADRQVYQHPFYAVPTLYRLAPGVDWDNSSWEIEVTVSLGGIHKIAFNLFTEIFEPYSVTVPAKMV